MTREEEEESDVGQRERIAAFCQALDSGRSEVELVEEFVLHGSCYAVDEPTQFLIKRRVSDRYDLNVTTDVFIVGSAKLGFSISPTKRWRPFGDHSDVDVAIVNHDIYERVWHEVDDYRRSGADWPKRRSFEGYLAKGWIRPDLLPTGPLFQSSGQWWDFFRHLKAERLAGPCKITGALYHDMKFLTSYQAGAVAGCRAERTT